MFRKNYFTILLTIALLLAGSVAAFAQTAPVTGKVVIKKADGSTVPAENAMVEVFRTDIKSKLPSDKTNKKGEFSFAGLPLGATFVLSVSAPGAKPGYLPNVKAGNENITITLEEGDGKRWTEEEVRAALDGAATTSVSTTDSNAELTEEQKKQKAEYEKKVAEVQAKNEKLEQQSATVKKALEEGGKAFSSKNFDIAIVKFDEGYKANPEYVGSAPVLLNNKALALRERAVDFHNKSVKETDAAAKADLVAKSRKDFADSVEAYNTAWTILKNAPATDITDQQIYQTNKQNTLDGFRNVAKYMIQTEKVEVKQIPTIAALLTEYLAVETDAAKKAEAGVFMGDIYRIVGDSPNAIVEYKKVLETSPNNPDALAGLGLSQVNAGYNEDGSINEAMMQEAINNLQRFSEVAPDDHKLKGEVKGMVEFLKTQNFKPQKTTKKKS
jgi:tetratricopeptide (TPR) repeat protein